MDNADLKDDLANAGLAGILNNLRVLVPMLLGISWEEIDDRSRRRDPAP